MATPKIKARSKFRNEARFGDRFTRRDFLIRAGQSGAAALASLWLGCNKPSATQPSMRSRGKTIVMGTAVDLYTLDPAVGFDTAISSTLKHLYDSLFRHVGNPPRVIPWLAQAHTVSDDFTQWQFTLDPKAVFHDGTPVNAHAVKYSAERVLKLGKAPAGLFQGLIASDGVQVVNDRVVRMTLSKPIQFFLHLLPWLFIVNPELIEANKGRDEAQTWLESHEAGSGPFTIETWEPGERYLFKAVTGYWKGWPRADHPERYERRVITDNSARLNALVKGRVDLVDWMTPDALLRFESTAGLHVVNEPGLETFELKLNNQVGPTADRHVRRAISYAFDYQALIDIWKGRADLLHGSLPPALNASGRDLAVYRLDMQRARASLAKSPWPGGGFDLDYVYVTGLEEERLAGEMLRRQLAELKIEVNIIPMAWADAVATFRDPLTSPPVFPLYTSAAYPDPNNYLWTGYHSSQAGEWTNPGHYRSPSVDLLLEQARSSMDQDRRNGLYHRVQQTLLQDAVNIFGIAIKDYHAYGDRIAGMPYCPVMGGAMPFYTARILRS